MSLSLSDVENLAERAGLQDLSRALELRHEGELLGVREPDTGGGAGVDDRPTLLQ